MTAAIQTETTRFGKGFLRDAWYFVDLGREIRPGTQARRMILGEPVLVGRTRAGQVFAMRDVCPHRAAPLSAGRVVHRAEDGGETIECPYHGWRFRPDGVCAAIPSLVEGDATDPSRIRVRSYPVRESQGIVFVWMSSDPRGAGEPDHEPPVFPGAEGEAKLVEAMTFDSHVDHAVVGLMDPAHGPYVHQQWWWRSEHSMHEKRKAFAPVEHGWAMVRHAPSSNSRAYKILGGAPATEITFRLPGYRWEHIQVGEKQVLALTCLTPLDDDHTRITQMFWSDHWVFDVAKPFLRMGVRAFLKQDGGMVNLQNMGLAYDPTLIWIDDADKQAKWYQQLKREWQKSRAEGRGFSNPIEPTTLRWRS